MVNGRNGIGPGAGEGVDGEDQHEEVTLLLMWTAKEVTRNVTADRTTLERVCQGHSTGIKNKDKLQLCQLVNKEKHFTDSMFKGSKRL